MNWRKELFGGFKEEPQNKDFHLPECDITPNDFNQYQAVGLKDRFKLIREHADNGYYDVYGDTISDLLYNLKMVRQYYNEAVEILEKVQKQQECLRRCEEKNNSE